MKGNVVAVADPVQGYGAKVTSSGSVQTDVANTVTVQPDAADTVTESVVNVGNTAGDLIAANTSRLTIEIWNSDATHAVHITLSSGTPTGDSPKIAPGAGWQLPGGARYTGQIRAICPTVAGAATIKIVCREYTA